MRKKIALIFILLMTFSCLTVYGEVKLSEPKSTFYSNDFADIIDEDVENNIIKVNSNYEETEEKPQIVLVTVPNMQGLDENTYAVKLFEDWKIGSKENDNGILILLALEERRIKIEVGYGLEGAVTDAEAGRILDSYKEYLSSGNYSQGIENIFLQLAHLVNEEYNYEEDEIFNGVNAQTENTSYISSKIGMIIRIVLIIIVLIIFGGSGGGPGRRRFFLPSIFRIGRSGGFGGGGFGGGSFGGGGSSGGGGAGRGF